MDIILAGIADTLAAGERVDKKPSRFAVSEVSGFVTTNRAWAEIRRQANGDSTPKRYLPYSIPEKEPRPRVDETERRD